MIYRDKIGSRKKRLVLNMKVQKRTEKGNKVRSLKTVPGVIYGGGLESTSITADLQEFTHIFREKGTSQTFEVTLDGKTHIVYIGEVQGTPLNQHLVRHFDLIKVAADATMTSKIRISLLNKEIVEKKGLIINTTLDSVTLEYAVGKGVSHIDLDVSELEEHDTLHVSDIVVPEGVKLLNDLDEVVLSVVAVKEEVEVVEPEEEILEVESIKQKDEE